MGEGGWEKDICQKKGKIRRIWEDLQNSKLQYADMEHLDHIILAYVCGTDIRRRMPKNLA